MEIIELIVVGWLISMLLVRRSSHKGLGVELTWLQAARVVFCRGVAGLTAGFALGALVGLGLSSGWLKASVLREHVYIVLPVVSLCGLASLLAFQKAMQFFTGKEISLVATVRTVLIELGYYVAFVVTLSLVIMIVLSLIEFWPILGPDYFLTVFMGTEG